MTVAFKTQLAAHVVSGGGVIAYPTEAVWGLGCDPFNEAAVMRLLQLKHRPMHKGLILIAHHQDIFKPLLKDLSQAQLEQLATTWPGPHTWLVPHNNLLPHWITGGFSTVALRVSSHPVVVDLCTAVNGPIVSTSANPQGKLPAINSLAVRRYFKAALDGILEGATGGLTQPSAIRDIRSGVVIRPG